MMCGAPVVREPADGARAARHPARDHETMRFIRAIISRPATFTFVFLTACVFLYLLMEFSGGAQGAVLIEYGAKVNRLIDERGEWWRFVTPIFLHVTVPGYGPLHLLTNMYGLFMLGPYVEKLYGSSKFVFFWMLTGVAGVATSYLTVRPELAAGPWGYIFKARDYPAAGASGALFGLVGVLFVFGIKYRKELPEDFKRAFGFGMLPMILLNLLHRLPRARRRGQRGAPRRAAGGRRARALRRLQATGRAAAPRRVVAPRAGRAARARRGELRRRVAQLRRPPTGRGPLQPARAVQPRGAVPLPRRDQRERTRFPHRPQRRPGAGGARRQANWTRRRRSTTARSCCAAS